MSFQERRAVVYMLGSIGTVVLYAAYMAQRYPDAGAYSVEVFRFWGLFFLLLIPVSIVTRIIIHILFSIVHTVSTQEEEPQITDERDHLIELRSTRNALYVFSVGVILAMGSLVLEMRPDVMFILLLGAGFGASLVDELSQFYFYRRGY